MGLLIIPAYFIWQKRKGWKHEGTMRIASLQLIPDAFRKRGNAKILFINILKVITVSLIIIALARPRIVESIQEKNVQVVDMVMVLDISSSMLAEDFNPNRLEAVLTSEQMLEDVVMMHKLHKGEVWLAVATGVVPVMDNIMVQVK